MKHFAFDDATEIRPLMMDELNLVSGGAGEDGDELDESIEKNLQKSIEEKAKDAVGWAVADPGGEYNDGQRFVLDVMFDFLDRTFGLTDMINNIGRNPINDFGNPVFDDGSNVG